MGACGCRHRRADGVLAAAGAVLPPILPLIHLRHLLRALAGAAAGWQGVGRRGGRDRDPVLAVPNLLQDGTFMYEQRLRGVMTDRRDPEGRGADGNGGDDREGDSLRRRDPAQARGELTYFSRRKVIAPPRSLRQPPSPKMEQRVWEDVLAVAERLRGAPRLSGEARRESVQ